MSNDKGTWFGWDVSKVGPVEQKDLYDMAKSFALSVGKGEIQAKHGTEETTKSNSNYQNPRQWASMREWKRPLIKYD